MGSIVGCIVGYIVGNCGDRDGNAQNEKILDKMPYDNTLFLRYSQAKLKS